MRNSFFSNFFVSREKLITYILFGLLFVFMVSMLAFVSYSSQEKETLLMKSEAERAFNSIYMALTEDGNTDKATTIMEKENVIGIGIYSSDGYLYRQLGSVPFFLPYEKFTIQSVGSGDSTLGLYAYDQSSGLLHYMRQARLMIELDAGGLMLDENGVLHTGLDFPEILYVVMDGSNYAKALSRITFLTVAALVLLIAVFILFLRLYIKNKNYREMLNKQESLVSLGAAARTLAHEIKNPLSAITIQIALLKKLLPPEYKGELGIVDKEIVRLTQLTNKVSDFLRNPLGNPELIELHSFLENIKGLFSNQVAFTQNSLEEAYVEFDPDRARSVFENLLKNAAESCSDRDPQVEIEIIEKKHGQVSVSVLDRGDGLPKGGTNKVFDPFFTTKIHGSGIGLSISRQFVKARGGNLSLLPREGGGTRAEVVLALVPLKFAHIMMKTRAESSGKAEEASQTTAETKTGAAVSKNGTVAEKEHDGATKESQGL